MLGGKPACPLLSWLCWRVHTPGPFPHRETLSPSPEAVHWTDILRMGVWNKEQLLPHLQDVQKHERPMENSFLAVQSRGSSAYWSEQWLFTCSLPGVMDVTTILPAVCLWEKGGAGLSQGNLCCDNSVGSSQKMSQSYDMTTRSIAPRPLARSVGLQVSARPATRVTRHPPSQGSGGRDVSQSWNNCIKKQVLKLISLNKCLMLARIYFI